MQHRILINVIILVAYVLNLPLNTQRSHSRSQRAGKWSLILAHDRRPIYRAPTYIAVPLLGPHQPRYIGLTLYWHCANCVSGSMQDCSNSIANLLALILQYCHQYFQIHLHERNSIFIQIPLHTAPQSHADDKTTFYSDLSHPSYSVQQNAKNFFKPILFVTADVILTITGLY